jgi:hypothetical protein
MFSIELNASNITREISSSSSLQQESHISEVFIAICNELSRYPKSIIFSVSGFGKNWDNLNIDSDLCMLMDDLPYMVDFALNDSVKEVQFGFPEQHIQRIFTMEKVASSFRIICSDLLSLDDSHTEEFIKPEDFKNLLRRLVEQVQFVVKEVYPVAYDNAAFNNWLLQVSAINSP